MSDHMTVLTPRTSFVQSETQIGGVQQKGTLGEEMPVHLGEGGKERAQGTSFGEKAKAFLNSVKSFFSSIGEGFAKIGASIKEAREERAMARAQAKVESWESAGANITGAPKPSGEKTDSCIGNLKMAAAFRPWIGEGDDKVRGKPLGSAGMHEMAKLVVDHFKANVDTDPSIDPPQTWQDVARDGLTNELLKCPNFKEAQKMIADLEKHFNNYVKAGGPQELAELGQIISSLKSEVTDIAKIDQMARTSFSNEVDKELGGVKNFFRGTSTASITSACLLRNGNAGATEGVGEAFRDLLTSRQNREDIALLDKLESGQQLGKEHMEALNRLTMQFMERAFGLGKDGGKAYSEKMDPGVKSFLQDTCQIIAGKDQVDVGTRNDAIRKWFSNGIALRDFGPIAAKIGQDLGMDKAGNQIATHILRLVGDVKPEALSKTSEEGVESYRNFIATNGPKFTEFLQSIGMPQVE